MSVGRYLWSAFNARPLGMPLPPNWLALASRINGNNFIFSLP